MADNGGANCDDDVGVEAFTEGIDGAGASASTRILT